MLKRSKLFAIFNKITKNNLRKENEPEDEMKKVLL